MEAFGYKLFNKKKDGKLYPLYVLTEKSIPLGVWLHAEEGPRVGNHVKSKLGPLAFRPGWHINDELPYVEHIYSMHNGEKYLKDGCVWCEVKYHTDISYQERADAEGWRNERWASVRSYLSFIPVNGYYKYKTNPQMYGKWAIAGEMMVVREMSDEEVYAMCAEQGLVALRRYEG